MKIKKESIDNKEVTSDANKQKSTIAPNKKNILYLVINSVLLNCLKYFYYYLIWD